MINTEWAIGGGINLFILCDECGCIFIEKHIGDVDSLMYTSLENMAEDLMKEKGFNNGSLFCEPCKEEEAK